MSGWPLHSSLGVHRMITLRGVGIWELDGSQHDEVMRLTGAPHRAAQSRAGQLAGAIGGDGPQPSVRDGQERRDQPAGERGQATLGCLRAHFPFGRWYCRATDHHGGGGGAGGGGAGPGGTGAVRHRVRDRAQKSVRLRPRRAQSPATPADGGSDAGALWLCDGRSGLVWPADAGSGGGARAAVVARGRGGGWRSVSAAGSR